MACLFVPQKLLIGIFNSLIPAAGNLIQRARKTAPLKAAPAYHSAENR
jgi:hypothetical protein